MLLVLFCFVTALALACGLGWINAQRSVAEIEDLNNVAVHQVDPLYEANGALLRTRLALMRPYPSCNPVPRIRRRYSSRPPTAIANGA